MDHGFHSLEKFWERFEKATSKKEKCHMGKATNPQIIELFYTKNVQYIHPQTSTAYAQHVSVNRSIQISPTLSYVNATHHWVVWTLAKKLNSHLLKHIFFLF